MITKLKTIFKNKPDLINEVKYYFCCGDDILSVYIHEILELIKYGRWDVIKNISQNHQKKIYIHKIINYCCRLKR